MSRQSKAASAQDKFFNATKQEILHFDDKKILLNFLEKTNSNNKPTLLVFYEVSLAALCTIVDYKGVDYMVAASPDSNNTLMTRFINPNIEEISDEIISAVGSIASELFIFERINLPFLLEQKHLEIQKTNVPSNELYKIIRTSEFRALLKSRYSALIDEDQEKKAKVAEDKKQQEAIAAQLAEQKFQTACRELRVLIEKHQNNLSKSLDHTMTLIAKNTANCKQLFSNIHRPTKKIKQEFDNLLSDANNLTQQCLLLALAEKPNGKKNAKQKPKIDTTKNGPVSEHREISSTTKSKQQEPLLISTVRATLFASSSPTHDQSNCQGNSSNEQPYDPNDGSYEVPADLPLPIPHGIRWADIID